MTLNQLFKYLAVGLLIFAPFNLPYVYYQFLRWFVTIFSIYLAHEYKNQNKGYWMWLFVAIAVLFNPVAPFYLSRELWKYFDIGVGIIFFISTLNKNQLLKLKVVSRELLKLFIWLILAIMTILLFAFLQS